MAGSLSAVSPEQYLGKPLGERSDLFALGCLLSRMLGGVPPFYRDGRLDARALLEGEPAPLAALVSADVELPPELTRLVTAMLQKVPANRPSSTRVVRQVLRRVARGIAIVDVERAMQGRERWVGAERGEIVLKLRHDIPSPGRRLLLRRRQ